MLWSPIYLIFNLTSLLLCFVEGVQDHLCRDLIFIKNSSNWKCQHFKGSAINAHSPHCPSSWRDTDTNCQVHVRRGSGFHIPGMARGRSVAKRGTQVRPSGNVICKKYLLWLQPACSQSPACTGVTGAARKAKQLSGGRGRQEAMVRKSGIPSWEWDGDLPCSASLELHLNLLICVTLHFPSQEVLLTRESTDQHVSGWWTYPLLHFFILG